MGPLIKYTNRLILRVENESKAKQVLDLYLRNRLPFEQYEPTRPASFYTQDYTGLPCTANTSLTRWEPSCVITSI